MLRHVCFHTIKYKCRYLIYCTQHVSRITFIRYAQGQKMGKPNNLKVFGSKKNKGHTWDSQNRQASAMLEGGEP